MCFSMCVGVMCFVRKYRDRYSLYLYVFIYFLFLCCFDGLELTGSYKQHPDGSSVHVFFFLIGPLGSVLCSEAVS